MLAWKAGRKDGEASRHQQGAADALDRARHDQGHRVGRQWAEDSAFMGTEDDNRRARLGSEGRQIVWALGFCLVRFLL